MNLERLYFLREEKDLTQKELAEELGINTRTSISEWENNKEIIPLDKLNRYANYFNVSIDYLVGLSDSKTSKFETRDLNLKEIAKRLLEVRTKHNLTQQQLALKLNTTHSTLSAYENAHVLIKTVFIYQIAKEYNYSIDYLLGKIN